MTGRPRGTPLKVRDINLSKAKIEQTFRKSKKYITIHFAQKTRSAVAHVTDAKLRPDACASRRPRSTRIIADFSRLESGRNEKVTTFATFGEGVPGKQERSLAENTFRRSAAKVPPRTLSLSLCADPFMLLASSSAKDTRRY